MLKKEISPSLHRRRSSGAQQITSVHPQQPKEETELSLTPPSSQFYSPPTPTATTGPTSPIPTSSSPIPPTLWTPTPTRATPIRNGNENPIFNSDENNFSFSSVPEQNIGPSVSSSSGLNEISVDLSDAAELSILEVLLSKKRVVNQRSMVDSHRITSPILTTDHELKMSHSRKEAMLSEDPEKCLFHCCVVGDLLTTQWLVEHREANISYSIGPNDKLLPSRYFQIGDTPLAVAVRYNNNKVADFLRQELSEEDLRIFEDSQEDVDTVSTEKAFQNALKGVSRTMKKKISAPKKKGEPSFLSRRPSEPIVTFEGARTSEGNKIGGSGPMDGSGMSVIEKMPSTDHSYGDGRDEEGYFGDYSFSPLRRPLSPPQKGKKTLFFRQKEKKEENRMTSQTPSPPTSRREKHKSKERGGGTSSPYYNSKKKGSGKMKARQSRPRPLSPSLTLQHSDAILNGFGSGIGGSSSSSSSSSGSGVGSSSSSSGAGSGGLKKKNEKKKKGSLIVLSGAKKGKKAINYSLDETAFSEYVDVFDEEERRSGRSVSFIILNDLTADELVGSPRTLDTLFDYLCGKTQAWEQIVQIFFLTYVIFTSWEEVCHSLILRWSDCTSHCILTIFGHWANSYQGDWDDERKKCFFQMLKESEIISSEDIVLFHNLFSSQFRNSAEWVISPLKERRKEKSKEPEVDSKLKHFQKKKKDSAGLIDHTDWLTWDEIMIAEQLAVYTWELLSSVQPREFINWNRSNRNDRCENLLKFNRYFDKLAYWVASEVSVRVKLTERITILEKFINIASLSLHINNFFGAKALYTGVVHPAVSRMKKTLDGLSRSTKSRFTKLHRILDMDTHNGAVYRAALKSTSPPFIPYIGLHQKDMVFTFDGSSTFLPLSPPSNSSQHIQASFPSSPSSLSLSLKSPPKKGGGHSYSPRKSTRNQPITPPPATSMQRSPPPTRASILRPKSPTVSSPRHQSSYDRKTMTTSSSSGGSFYSHAGISPPSPLAHALPAPVHSSPEQSSPTTPPHFVNFHAGSPPPPPPSSSSSSSSSSSTKNSSFSHFPSTPCPNIPPSSPSPPPPSSFSPSHLFPNFPPPGVTPPGSPPVSPPSIKSPPHSSSSYQKNLRATASSSPSPSPPPSPPQQLSYPPSSSPSVLSSSLGASGSPVQGNYINISKFHSLWSQISDLMVGVTLAYDFEVDEQMKEYLADPPNLDLDSVFEWSSRVEPRDVENLISEFITSETRLNQNLNDLTADLKVEREKRESLEEECKKLRREKEKLEKEKNNQIEQLKDKIADLVLLENKGLM